MGLPGSKEVTPATPQQQPAEETLGISFGVFSLESAHKTYVSSHRGNDNGEVHADETECKTEERFKIYYLGNSHCALKNYANNQYLGAENDGDHTVACNKDVVGPQEKWEIHKIPSENGFKFAFKSWRGTYFCAEPPSHKVPGVHGRGQCLAKSESIGPWEQFIVRYEGEYLGHPAPDRIEETKYGFAHKFESKEQFQAFTDWCDLNNLETFYQSSVPAEWPAEVVTILFAPATHIEFIKKNFYTRDYEAPQADFAGTRYLVLQRESTTEATTHSADVLSSKQVTDRDIETNKVAQFGKITEIELEEEEEAKLLRLQDKYAVFEVPLVNMCIPAHVLHAGDQFPNSIFIHDKIDGQLSLAHPPDKTLPIAIVDSGICRSITERGPIKCCKNFGQTIRTKFRRTGTVEDGGVDDVDGHGTQMYSIIRTLLPENPIIVAKVANGNNWPVTNLFQGIKWAVNEGGAKIVSVSANPPTPTTELADPLFLFEPLLREIDKLAESNGATIYIAAGNENQTLWQDKFEALGLTRFYIVGSKACVNMDDLRSIEWSYFCKSAKTAQLLISHGENFITRCSAEHDPRFDQYVLSKESWKSVPSFGDGADSAAKYVIGMGTSHATALYAAISVYYAGMKKDATTDAAQEECIQILKHILKKCSLYDLEKLGGGSGGGSDSGDSANTSKPKNEVVNEREIGSEPATTSASIMPTPAKQGGDVTTSESKSEDVSEREKGSEPATPASIMPTPTYEPAKSCYESVPPTPHINNELTNTKESEPAVQTSPDAVGQAAPSNLANSSSGSNLGDTRDTSTTSLTGSSSFGKFGDDDKSHGGLTPSSSVEEMLCKDTTGDARTDAKPHRIRKRDVMRDKLKGALCELM